MASPSPSSTASSPFDMGTELISAGLESLQQEEQQKLMDEIDRLRSAGISEHVSLPQLVVCGDQSSGKSSVLEAITEIPFPRRANLCTRFATQIMLRREPVERATVRIIPFNQRKPEDKERLKKFTASIESFADLPDLIDAASEVMGVGVAGGSAFARDTLSIEIFGPDKPQLTIVDTPGLIHSETRAQTQADIDMVSDLVRDYMHNPRTIILAVVSARNDIANQVVLQRARAADPSGERTLGIITKPDTAGHEMEDAFVALARNEDIPLSLGWHVLRNRSTDERDFTFAQRNREENLFFQRRPWSSLPTSDVGIESLRTKLSWLLFDHIRRELPRVRQDIMKSYTKASTELESLGISRSTTDEQRAYLIDISQKLTDRCRAAVQGNYEDSFFIVQPQGSWKKRRLRAGVQKDNTTFAEAMRISGHFREIEGNHHATHEVGDEHSQVPVQITKDEAIDWVRPFIEASRGRELPGSYNPLLVRDLFLEQSQRWDKIARCHVRLVWKRCKAFLETALSDLAPPDVVEGLWECYLRKAIKSRLKRANEELEELILDKSSVITYNHYYTENIQKNRLRNLQHDLNHAAEGAGIPRAGLATVDAAAFWQVAGDTLQPNMDDFACEEVLDSMLAYYKVALKTFVDNVATIVIERRLLRDLPTIFSPSIVANMPPTTISEIAEESQWQKERRQTLNATIKSLEQGKAVFERAMRSPHNTRVRQEKPVEPETDDTDDDDDDDMVNLLQGMSLENPVSSGSARSSPRPSASRPGAVQPPQSASTNTHGEKAQEGPARLTPDRGASGNSTNSSTDNPAGSFHCITPSSLSRRVPQSRVRRKSKNTPATLAYSGEQVSKPFGYQSAPRTSRYEKHREKEGSASVDSIFDNICAVPEFREWSQEELRLRDYQERTVCPPMVFSFDDSVVPDSPVL